MKEKKKRKKEEKNFYCILCQQGCKSKFNLIRHFSTTKHKMKQNETKMKQNETKMKQKREIELELNFTKTEETNKKPLQICCELCNKTFNSRTTLWRHKKKCDFQIVEKKVDKKDGVVDKLLELLPKMTEAIIALAEKPNNVNTNCNNNNMTINMYLNEECKNAMNLNDFVNKVKVSIEDLIYTKKNGYVEGISNIFIKNLTDMDPKERPIHCSNKNKRQFYIKDKDKWNQDKNNNKINKTISFIEKKQILKIKEWEKLHPNYLDDDVLTEEWQNMFRTAFHDAEKKDLDNIHKNVSEAVIIDEITKD